MADVHGFEDLLLVESGPVADLGDAGGASQLLGEVIGSAHHREVALLERAWRTDAPRAVPEVTLQLAQDRDPGERHEGPFPARVEPVDGVEEADPGDLDEVLEALPPGPNLTDQADGEPVVMGEKLAADPWITTGCVLDEPPCWWPSETARWWPVSAQ